MAGEECAPRASSRAPHCPHYLLLTTYFSLLATHYSLLTTHHSPLTTHYSLLTTHHSPLTTHFSLLQDPAAQLVGLLAAPEAGQTVLELCAAPGGKSTHLAEIMGDAGRVLSVEARSSDSEE